MNVKARRTKKQVNVENQAIMLLSKEELDRKIEVIKKELRSYTWRDLETNGKFAKNDKLSFITDDMLIAGCDIGSETHYIRAIDVRGRELSGMGLVACSSGKHKGQTKISHRGRKRLRYWLFQAAKSAVSHADEFKQLHEYYTTRTNNPLKKMQSLVVIACKILRVIYTILKTGTTYDPQKLLKDIKHPAASQAPMAA